MLFTPARSWSRKRCSCSDGGALARQFVEDDWQGYAEQLTSLGVSRSRAIPTLLWDGRYSLLTVVLAGFGRAASEVGAVMIVGGKHRRVTRVMTTPIALETSKGDLPLALAPRASSSSSWCSR
jgi:tungstate transport system permease protein